MPHSCSGHLCCFPIHFYCCAWCFSQSSRSTDWPLYPSLFHCWSCFLIKIHGDLLTLTLSWFEPIYIDNWFEKKKKGNWQNSITPCPTLTMTFHHLTVTFHDVVLTWSTLCVHIFRRELQTNMAVRLCDVASLLRSGSWAPEPWTGVCGTSFLTTYSLGAQPIPMTLAVQTFWR